MRRLYQRQPDQLKTNVSEEFSISNLIEAFDTDGNEIMTVEQFGRKMLGELAMQNVQDLYFLDNGTIKHFLIDDEYKYACNSERISSDATLAGIRIYIKGRHGRYYKEELTHIYYRPDLTADQCRAMGATLNWYGTGFSFGSYMKEIESTPEMEALGLTKALEDFNSSDWGD